MAIISIILLIAGILVGQFFGDNFIVSLVPSISNWVLYFLVISAGIGVGACKSILAELRNYNIKILLYPLTIIVCSVLGGLFCGILPGSMGVQNSMAVASGLSWYGLVGPLISDLSGDSAVGAVAFLANLFREIIGFIFLPILCKIFGAGAGVAVGGASSQDTLLPTIVRYGGKEITIPSVISGVVCAFAVTVVARIIYSI